MKQRLLSFCALLVVAQCLTACIVDAEPYHEHGYYDHHCGWRCR